MCNLSQGHTGSRVWGRGTVPRASREKGLPPCARDLLDCPLLAYSWLQIRTAAHETAGRCIETLAVHTRHVQPLHNPPLYSVHKLLLDPQPSIAAYQLNGLCVRAGVVREQGNVAIPATSTAHLVNGVGVKLAMPLLLDVVNNQMPLRLHTSAPFTIICGRASACVCACIHSGGAAAGLPFSACAPLTLSVPRAPAALCRNCAQHPNRTKPRRATSNIRD